MMRNQVDIFCPFCGVKIHKARPNERPNLPDVFHLISSKVDGHMSNHSCIRIWFDNEIIKYRRDCPSDPIVLDLEYAVSTPLNAEMQLEGSKDFFDRMELEIELEMELNRMGAEGRAREIYKAWIRAPNKSCVKIAAELNIRPEIVKAEIGQIHIARMDGWLEQEMNKV